MNDRENNNQETGMEFEDLFVVPPAGTADSFSEMVNASYRAGILLDASKGKAGSSETMTDGADAAGEGGPDTLDTDSSPVPVGWQPEVVPDTAGLGGGLTEQPVETPAYPAEHPNVYDADMPVEEAGYQEDAYRTQEAILARISRGWERLKHEPVVIACLVILLFIVVFVRAFLVPSGSMRPTLVEGDRILSIATYFPNGQTFNRGDIVCFKERNSGQVYVKRVIGKGGDVIEITGEDVYVNGELSEYQGTGGVLTATRVVLGEDQYWVMGDNRGNSEDSRFIGPVSADQMISKVWVLYWPLNHFTLL